MLTVVLDDDAAAVVAFDDHEGIAELDLGIDVEGAGVQRAAVNVPAAVQFDIALADAIDGQRTPGEWASLRDREAIVTHGERREFRALDVRAA